MSAADAPSNWDDVKAGQTVSFRNADGVEVEIVIADRSPLTYTGNQWVHSGLCRYLTCEWELLAIKPALPTEPGWYLANAPTAVVYLAADGYWTTPGAFGVTGEDMREHGPFTRLVPQAAVTRADLVALFESEADWYDDKLRIPVENAADLILDHPELAASIRPEPIESATPLEKGIAPAGTGATQQGRQADAQLR